MSRDGNRRRVLTQDERVLWTIVTKSIAPLRTSPLPLGEVGERSEPGEGLQPIESRLPPHPNPPSLRFGGRESKPAIALATAGNPLPRGEREHAESAAASRPQPPPLAPPLTPLGRRMRARVARGKQAIDGRLDLHGLTQSEAHSALLHFLRNAIARDS